MGGQAPEERIRKGIGVAEALGSFRELVNQPGTTFSTDRWLLPKLERLSALLHEPITSDEAAALLDVLRDRRAMRDLIEWLEGEPVSWPNFFVRRKFIEDEAVRVKQEELKRKDEEWARRNTEWGAIESLLTPAERDKRELERFQARRDYLSKAKSCRRCGTPPEYLEWFYYCSPPSSWAWMFGRAGWKTRCKSCQQLVDFFIGMRN